MSKVVIKHGMILQHTWCAFCQRFRRATIKRENIRWLKFFRDCGHTGFLGYVAPPEKLEELGYLQKQSKGQELEDLHTRKLIAQEELERQLSRLK